MKDKPGVPLPVINKEFERAAMRAWAMSNNDEVTPSALFASLVDDDKDFKVQEVNPADTKTLDGFLDNIAPELNSGETMH